MKKVLALVLAALLMTAAVFAAPTAFTPNENGEYSVGYTEGTENNYYALLVVSGIYAEGETPAISEDTVLYIDQGTADANGDVSFEGWIPKNDTEATVYLGGSDLDDGPVLLGYLSKEEEKFTVAGKVTTDSNTTYEATVTLTDAEGNAFTGTSALGAYSVEVPKGTYTFKVTVKNHLSYTDNELAVEADISEKNVALKGGDIDGMGSVEFADLNTVLVDYGKESEADIDGNGTVEFADLNTVLTNYGSIAVEE